LTALAEIGMLGGSGLSAMEALADREEVTMTTPYGSPSDPLIIGTVEMVIATLQHSVSAAQATLTALCQSLAAERGCGCGQALANAILTEPSRVPPETRQRTGLLVGPYLGW
jgi:5'-methylthioadenosine phosphorylase